jgi:hypothetical protein
VSTLTGGRVCHIKKSHSLSVSCVRVCIQKFPGWIDNEINNNNKHSLRSKTQRVMAAKLTRLTHKIAIQLHLVPESCTICSSRSRRLVRKLLDTPSYILFLYVFPFFLFFVFFHFLIFFTKCLCTRHACQSGHCAADYAYFIY